MKRRSEKEGGKETKEGVKEGRKEGGKGRKVEESYNEAKAKVFSDDVPGGADLVFHPEIVDCVPPSEEEVEQHWNRDFAVLLELYVEERKDDEGPTHNEWSVREVLKVESEKSWIKLHSIPNVFHHVSMSVFIL